MSARVIVIFCLPFFGISVSLCRLCSATHLGHISDLNIQIWDNPAVGSRTKQHFMFFLYEWIKKNKIK